MKDEGIDTEGIFFTLLHLNFDLEIDEDIYFKVEAFLNIYNVFESNHS